MENGVVAIKNNNNTAINMIDQDLHDIINASEKLKTLNNMMQSAVKEVEEKAA